METTLIAAVRAIHFGAAIVLFGQFVFLWAVSPDREPPAHFRRTALWCAALVLASAVAWLALEAGAMSGLAPSEALSASTLGVVATQTLFGRVWVARVLLAGTLLLMALMRGRPPAAAGGILAGLLLATIAGTGHAVGGQGVDRWVRVCADGLHLLSAGAWLGALVPLLGILRRSSALAVRAAERFSTLGVASIAAIALSGMINAYYTVPDAAALVHTQYGRLLIAKISLFLLIVILAVINRSLLLPRLAASGAASSRSLRRNAIVECLLGFGIVAVAGELGITMPALHH
ncbi:MAG TPA: copper homeostasis membrane protein CopD [Burkholderiales bacterium]|nr:copper homeostasis membrane protein CopD [Burkholderiales bacterium]